IYRTVSFQNHLAPLGAQCEVLHRVKQDIRGRREAETRPSGRVQMHDSDFDTNQLPLAYLITVRSFGTWLHGDERLAVDRHGFNQYATPRRPHNVGIETVMNQNMIQPPVLFNGAQCKIIEEAIKDVCRYRSYELLA